MPEGQVTVPSQSAGAASFPPNGEGLCRWGATLAGASKSLATVFDRMSTFYLDATRELAMVAQDPARLSDAYTIYGTRLTQLQGEMQDAMACLQRDAEQLYENLRRALEGLAVAPGTSPMGASSLVAPSMRYGAAASEGVTGPGDWRFEPAGRASGPDNTPVTKAPEPVGAASPSPFSAMWPARSMGFQVSPGRASSAELPVPMPGFDDGPRSDGLAAQEPAPADDADVRASLADARAVLATRPTPPPAAPVSVYPRASDTQEVPMGVHFRCGTYRRVARAKP